MKGFLRGTGAASSDALSPRHVGRLVGGSYLGTGLLALLALPPFSGRIAPEAVALLAVPAVVIGGVFLLAPWNRWPAGLALLVAPSGFGLAAAATWLTAGGPIPEAGLLYVLVTLSLIGLVLPPGSALLLAPLAAASFLVPALVRTGEAILAGATAFAVPVGVLLGELLAWVVNRWRESERSVREAHHRLTAAYRRQRADLVRLQEVDAMKNAFLAAVSHELRTPLTAILGISTTLERSEVFLPDADRRDLMSRITTNGRRLQQLLSDLLDLNRLTHGVLEPELRPTDLGALVRRVAGEADIPDHRIEIVAPSVWLAVDAPKVERIADNLIRNAGKYTPPGTNVWIRLEAQPEGVLLLVEDDGPGVPHQLKREIFEPFRQGVSLPQPGAGIGLSLVQRFAAMHGGTAEVWDRPGGGASFRVFLPGTPTVADPQASVWVGRAEAPRAEASSA